MNNLINSHTPYINETIFNVLINKAKNTEFDKRGGNSKCSIIENYAVLKTNNIPGHDDSFSKMIDTLQKLKENDINVVPILGYGVIEQGESFPNGERYDKGYIIQEKAPGKELLIPKELKGKTNEECREIVTDYMTMLRDIPQEHYDKWVSDFKSIDDNKVTVDPSKESNFFYDKEKGFSFIDLNFFSKEPIFDELDSDGQNHHAKFIRYTFTPFNRMFLGLYNNHLQGEEDFEFFENAKVEIFDKYLNAMSKVGISREEVEYVFDQFNIPNPHKTEEHNFNDETVDESNDEMEMW